MPSGIVITRKKYIKKIEQEIAYLNSKDTTIMGSRNGQAPLFLWYTIRTRGSKGFAADVRVCIENAQFLHRSVYNSLLSFLSLSLSLCRLVCLFSLADPHSLASSLSNGVLHL